MFSLAVSEWGFHAKPDAGLGSLFTSGGQILSPAGSQNSSGMWTQQVGMGMSCTEVEASQKVVACRVRHLDMPLGITQRKKKNCFINLSWFESQPQQGLASVSPRMSIIYQTRPSNYIAPQLFPCQKRCLGNRGMALIHGSPEANLWPKIKAPAGYT